MKLLLDTHVLLWVLADPQRIDEGARNHIEDMRNTILLSSVCTWEIATKHSLGKLALPEAPEVLIARALDQLQGMELSINNRHALLSASFPKHHNDPFDRLLLAQAVVEGAILVTADDKLRLYSGTGATILWVC
jgi:PIN domain nuclease of toxin-antitoxin system